MESQLFDIIDVRRFLDMKPYSADPACPLTDSTNPSERLLHAAARIMHLLLAAKSPEEGVSEMLQTLRESHQVDDVVLLQRERTSEVPRVLTTVAHACRGQSTAEVASELQREWDFEQLKLAAAFDALAAGRAVYGCVATLHEPARSALDALNLQAYLFVPVLVSGEVWGCIGFFDRHRERVWSPSEIAAAVLVASTLGDLMARKILQEQLAQSQKMEAVGQLAGGIAHDFNNLLTGILGYVNILRVASERRELVVKAADVIEQAAHRAEDLTSRLLGFARRGKNQNIPVDLNALVREVGQLLRRTFGEHVTLKLNAGVEPVWTHGDPSQLQRVVLNLIINARDAIYQRWASHPPAQDGEISVSVRRLENRRGVPGDRVELRVSDNGCGIDPSIRHRLFEPFFTTKEPGRGSGMGLAMVYGIVSNHDGSIEVENQAGGGATFAVQLPYREPTGADTEVSEDGAPAVLTRSQGRILVVEDDEIARETTKALLRELGYRVVAVPNGEEAVRYFQQWGREIDLVVLDMMMPRLSGRECFLELRRIRANARVILMTGYGLNNQVQEILNLGVDGFIHKPFRLEELSREISRVLGAGQPREAAAAN